MFASFLSLFWQIYKLKCYISTLVQKGFWSFIFVPAIFGPGTNLYISPGSNIMATRHGEPLVPVRTTIRDYKSPFGHGWNHHPKLNVDPLVPDGGSNETKGSFMC